MSFLSRRPSWSGNRGSDAGRDAEHDDYDYAPDGYARGDEDDTWSANEYFSPEGIKGRRPAGYQPGDRQAGRGDSGQRDSGQRDSGQRETGPGYGYNDSLDGAGYDNPRYDNYGCSKADYDGGDSFQGGGNGGYGPDEYATGAFDLPDGTSGGRGDRGGRRRKERGGLLRLRRDKGEDIWPEDGVSDEDYWASVAADRPLTPANSPVDVSQVPPRAEPGRPEPPRGGTGRLGPAPGLVSDYQPASGRAASGGFPRADAPPPTPSFSPNGRPQDRSDWGERFDWGEHTERIERVTATGYPDPRASGRGPGRATGQEDPLTSSAYSRSALADADGRSYRAAARRSQAQAKLTEETQTLGAPVSYPGDRYPADRYQRPAGQAQTGEHPAARYAQEPTARYPAYGSQQPGQAPQPAQAQPGQRGGSGRVSLPGPGPSGAVTGQYPIRQPQQQSQVRQPPQTPPGQQPPSQAGGNPYDSAVTGSYPYPGQPGYPSRQPQQPPASEAPNPNAREGRRRRPTSPDPYGTGYGTHHDDRY